MLKVIASVAHLLTKKEKIHLALLMIVFCISAMMEVLGVASILPYISVLTNPNAELSGKIIGIIQQITDETNEKNLKIILGYLVLISMIMGSLLTGISTWLILRFAMLRTHTISQVLLRNYLNQNYEYFLKIPNTKLLQNLLAEVATIVGGILAPLIQLFTKISVVLMVTVMLIYVDHAVAISTILTFTVFYALIYRYKSVQLKKLGQRSVSARTKRYKILTELFSGIKEVKLWRLEEKYYQDYSKASEIFAEAESRTQLISLFPKYFIEIVTFGGMIILTIVFTSRNIELNYFLPLISLYTLAAYKLLPSMQQIFVNMASITYSTESLQHILMDYKFKEEAEIQTTQEIDVKKVTNTKYISFEDVIYEYPQGRNYRLGPINLNIERLKITGISGESGSGKTTLIDLMLGLLIPKVGEIKINGRKINIKKEVDATIGYVPQNVFLTNNTVKENIAFGVEEKNIDDIKIEKVAKLANIFDFISGLPNGFNALLSEHGKNLSGGQRQRIAIARALYKDPSILVLDEATSALDKENTDEIISQIIHLKKILTIVIITHNIEILNICDKVITLENGQVKERSVDDGKIQTI